MQNRVPFPEGTISSNIGAKVGDVFIVAVDDVDVGFGKKVVLVRDYKTKKPHFVEEEFYINKSMYCEDRVCCLYWSKLAPLITDQRKGENNMSQPITVQQILDTRMNENDKFLREQGIISPDGYLTPIGKDMFNVFMLDKFKGDFVEMLKALTNPKADETKPQE